MIDRLSVLEKNLRRLYEQLAGMENALILAPAGEKVRIRQQIEDLKQEIAEFETELRNLSASMGSGGASSATQPGNSTQTIAGGTGFQVNQPQGTVIQGDGNHISVNYGHNPSPVKPQPGSRVQQLRIDRLQRELDQLEEEYQAVSEELSVSLNPTDQVRLKRLLEQLETKMAAIEAAINS